MQKISVAGISSCSSAAPARVQARLCTLDELVAEDWRRFCVLLKRKKEKAPGRELNR